MPKKVILYPLVKETKYYEQSEWNDERWFTGKPRVVAGSLIFYAGYTGWRPTINIGDAWLVAKN